MTDCPGYINVKVNIWPTSPDYRPLVNCDVLVSCPPTFSVSFSLPLRVAEVTRSVVEDCILECVLEDGKAAHHLMLRPMLGVRRSSDHSPRPTEVATTKQSYVDDDERLKRRADTDLSTLGVAVLLATSIMLTVVWLCCELFRLTKVRHRSRRSPSTGANWAGFAAPRSSSSPPSSVRPRQQLSVVSRRTVSTVHVALRFLYSIVFTFSVFTVVVSVALRLRPEYPVTATSRFKSPPRIDEFEVSRLASSRSRVTCLAATTTRLMDSEPVSSRRFAAFADSVVASIGSVRTAAVRWSEQTAERFLENVEVGLKRQRRYAEATSFNRWLIFPRALYNKTTERDSNHAPPTSTTEDAFWNFLRVRPSEVNLSSFSSNMRERLAFIIYKSIARGVYGIFMTA